MITVEEAKALVDSSIEQLESETVLLSDALGRVLMTAVCSKVDIPGFDQSAMDGYAVCAMEDIVKGTEYEVIDEIQAGDVKQRKLKTGQAMRIYTGAALPEGANTIIIQEIVHREGNRITLAKDVKKGMNVRLRGEQIAKGEEGLPAGYELTPAGIGFLAMMGHDRVEVVRKPVVYIVVTGNELVAPGKNLAFGQIYESNSVTIDAALRNTGFESKAILFVKDSRQDTYNAFKEALDNADVILSSGGISVGDYDFVGDVMQELGVEQVFYKVKQKPGKPLFFGRKGNKYVFALPGNPASALTGYYQYVLPALRKLAGKGFRGLEQKQMKLSGSYRKKGVRAQFLKAFAAGDTVRILEGQSSAMMHTYATSNALVYIPWDRDEVARGEEVTVFLLR